MRGMGFLLVRKGKPGAMSHCQRGGGKEEGTGGAGWWRVWNEEIMAERL